MYNLKIYLFRFWTQISLFFVLSNSLLDNTKHLSALFIIIIDISMIFILLYIVFLYSCFVFVNGETMLDLKNLKPKLQWGETISSEQKIPSVPELIQGGGDFVSRKIIKQ